MAVLSLRPQAAGIRGRVRDAHLDGSLTLSGSQGRKRAYGRVPKNRGKNMTLIASMSLYGMGESMCIERGPRTLKPSRLTTSSTFWPLRFLRGRWW